MQRTIPPEPEPPLSRDDIVADIMRELGGVRGRSLILPDADTRANPGNIVRVEVITLTGRVPREPSGGNPIPPEKVVRAEVVRSVQRLSELDLRQGRSREERRAVADYNKSVDAKITELETMLKDWRAPRPAAGFTSEMELMRAGCQKRMELRPKGGQQTDQVKLACARCAFDLMKRFSRHKIKGSANSSFQVITARLYEAVTGEPDANVKRACDAVLRLSIIRRAAGKAAMDGAASVAIAGTVPRRD
jgi:hypothetical protein